MKGRHLLDQGDHLGNTWPSILPAVVNSPPPGVLLVGLAATFSIDAMRVVDGSDVVDHVDFEVREGSADGTLLKSLATTTGNLGIVVLPALLSSLAGKTLYVRARAVGQIAGVGPWGEAIRITT